MHPAKSKPIVLGHLLLEYNGEQELLAVFSEAANELRSRSLWQQKNVLNWRWTMNHETGSEFKHNLTNPESITAFLADIRKFHLTKEPLYFPKILNLVERRLQQQDLKGRVKRLREQYRSILKRGGVRIMYGKKELLPSELLTTYLNGLVFHVDSDKRQVIRELEQADLVPRIAMLEAAVRIGNSVLQLDTILEAAKAS